MTPGQVLAARYELRRVIGRGGMGEVWVGHDRVLGREVAIKVLDVRAGQDDVAADRFQREATAAASLAHPNVVTVYDAGVRDGVAFLVMELLTGPTVARLVKDGPLPVEQALELASQAADGLAAVHRVGVVHRDVKPGNLMLGGDGRLKLVDFGIARLAATTTTQLTGTGDVVGSAAYLSPEQARGEAATPASDHYALGCTLMTMLTGQPPFAGEHPMAVLRQHLDEPAPRVRDRRPDVPPRVDELVADLLDKDPARRAAGVASLLPGAAPVDDDHVTTTVLPSATAVLPGATAVLPSAAAGHPAAAVRRRGLPGWAWLALLVAGVLLVLTITGLARLLADDPDPRADPAAVESTSEPTQAATTPAEPTTAAPPPPDESPASLAEAIDDLEAAIDRAAAGGGLEDEAAEDLQRRVDDLRKKSGDGDEGDGDEGDGDEGDGDDDEDDEGGERGERGNGKGGGQLDKKLRELSQKVDDLEAEGRLDEANATQIRRAVAAVAAL